METSIQEDTALDRSIKSAPAINKFGTLAKKNTLLRGSKNIGTSECIKDKFGEEVPALGQKWWSNSTADSPVKGLREARYCPENCITFDTKYTINYYNEEGIPIESPIEDPVEEPIPAKKLMWNRERASGPSDTVHSDDGLAVNFQELIKMETDTPNHPRHSATNDRFDENSEANTAPIINQFAGELTAMQVINHQEKPATGGSFDINPRISHSAVENERAEESFTAISVSADREISAIDNSLGNKISNTMRNLAAKGLQVVNDLDEKAAARAQFFFDGTEDQYTDDHVAAMTATRRHDKSSTNSSLGSRVSSTMRNLAEVGLQVIHDLDEKAARHARFSLDSPTPMEQEPVVTSQTNPFEKFLHTIKRRSGHRKTTSCDMPRNRIEGGLFESPITSQRPGHRKSLSGSSYGFVNNMKSVGTSLASFSIVPRSRTGMSSRHQRTDYSSRASYAGRASEDNGNCLSRAFILDKDVIKRMEQRQGVIEEIISTEKAYLDDIQALIRVFDGLLIAIPILSQSLRKSIVLTLKDIWNHNNELYNELVTVVANTNKSSGVGVVNPPNHPPVKGHKRWQSLGEAPASDPTESRGRHIGDPKVAGEIAKVFCGKIPGLFLYESFGIMHSEVMKQIHTSYRTTDEWKDFNQAIRSTEEMIISTDNRENGSRKGRHFDDYFIKPIHRIARYEVLFGRLLEQSPVCDCPESSTTVETALFRIKEVHKTMNSAAGNHQKATAMSRTWLLQDRLLFTSQPESRSRDKVRMLEQNHLCGVLHACWQTKDTVAGRNITGQYLIALLYEKFFVLAQPSGTQDEVYVIQACIPISELTVEDVDNGKGLQCHTAPHSWKIVFEHISQLFEIIVSACSAKEELEWKSRLIDRSSKPCNSTVQQEMTASLSFDIKPMGTVYGKPGTVARRNSIHRATTMKGQTTIPRSVIVRNTSATVEPSLSSSASQLSINRSQSLAGPHRPTVLAPPRTERVRLETLLADVWTRDIIPYPGMGSRAHREHTVRASASSMMRKISHASIYSITKRSGSIASLHKSAEDHTATELDSLRPMVVNRQARHSSSESVPLPEDEHSLCQDASGGRHGSRLAVIIDEKEGSAGTGAARSTAASPIVARLASFRSKKSSGSLDDSLNSKRSTGSKSPSGKSSLALPIVTAAHGEEVRKENVLHSSMTVDGSSGGEEVAGELLQAHQRKGRNRTMLMEGFKNLFR
ncbi:hypothetical protein BCIN_01g06240 [Botrytis cinerea B05.10]|uniref:DH domain-containing protein n=1 Tax=Botryotinia fuckeliana (strain B05.10) TaxID=332648 RepID=A0A384J5H8_BOTFB|nr:hypothetical protein BCIN_01g06240 [Botrytis cinerea B05.10]ATZ45928.1 hypothetical protein BCIN_01g06240 [Botrytis cinerea B05.10]